MNGPVFYITAAVIGVLLLIHFAVGTILAALWFVVKLPFRLLWFILYDVLIGIAVLAWNIFSAFFALFGIFGIILKWIIVAALIAFAVKLLCEILR